MYSNFCGDKSSQCHPVPSISTSKYFTSELYSLNFKILIHFLVFRQCFVFHLYKGVRAGGGIGDEIGEPDGDDYEVYRIMFDITFFFFVIVILLAIIQGKRDWIVRTGRIYGKKKIRYNTRDRSSQV